MSSSFPSGRALLLVALLALAAATVAALWLIDRGGQERTPSAANPSAANPAAPVPQPPVPAAEPLTAPEGPAQDLPPARRDARDPTGILVLRIVPSEGLAPGGAVRVALRSRPEGNLVREAVLAVGELVEELECAPGAYSLEARSEDESLGSRPVEARVAAGERRPIQLRLLRRVPVLGSVLDTAGKEVEGLAVSVRAAKRIEARTLTELTGRFRLSGVFEGDYELVLGDPDGPVVPPRPHSVRAPVSGSLDPLLELVVPVLLSIEVLVVDDQGLPVSGARVEGRGEQGGRVEVETDAEGRARAGFLPAGSYRLFASHDTLGRGNRLIQLAADTAQPIELRLLRGRPPQ